MPTSTPAPTSTPTLATVVESVSAGVVQILNSSGDAGSGFLIDADGLVVTNAHVVGEFKTVDVSLADGLAYQGEVLGIDEIADLALLDIRAFKDFEPVTLGDSDAVDVGHEVIVMGFPLGTMLGESPTVTTGVVSAKRTTDEGVVRLQTDAAINPGNSGGPLFNRAGEVIGVNTAKHFESQDGRSVEGIGFAVAINEVKDRLDSLARGEDVLGPTATPDPAFGTKAPPEDAYQNGAYGFSITVAPGWSLDEETESDQSVSFWSSDQKAYVSVRVLELSVLESLEELAKERRDELTRRSASWSVFELKSFQRRWESGREYYQTTYRWQSASAHCVSYEIEQFFLSSWYPEKTIGFRLTTGTCEDESDTYAADTELMLDSFEDWQVYENSAFGFNLHIAPGWSLDKSTETERFVSFWGPDRIGTLQINAFDLADTYSLKAFADWRKSALELEGAAWELLDITSFQRRLDDGRETYWMIYRRQESSRSCISHDVELITLSAFFPDKSYGYTVKIGICEHSVALDNGDRQKMLESFSD